MFLHAFFIPLSPDDRSFHEGLPIALSRRIGGDVVFPAVDRAGSRERFSYLALVQGLHAAPQSSNRLVDLQNNPSRRGFIKLSGCRDVEMAWVDPFSPRSSQINEVSKFFYHTPKVATNEPSSVLRRSQPHHGSQQFGWQTM